jgi:hypothetical protein
MNIDLIVLERSSGRIVDVPGSNAQGFVSAPLDEAGRQIP